jgi:PAS domain S-box-containing protein
MNDRSDPRMVRRLSVLTAAAAVSSAMIGLSVLAGWTWHVASLTNWGTPPTSMVANAAVCFILIGVALWCVREQENGAFPLARSLAARISAVAVGVVGLLSLTEHIFKLDFALDQMLLVVPPAMQSAHQRPGLMPTVSATAFLLLSLALLTIDWRTRVVDCPAQWLAVAAGACASFGVLSYALDPNIYGAHLALALPGAVAFSISTMGLLCARTEWGLGALLCSRNLGGSMARRLVVVAFIPVAVGWLRWRISAGGHFSEWSIVVLASLTTPLLMAGLIGWAALAVDRDDKERREAEESSKRMAAIVDSSDDAIVSETVKGMITAWNRAAEKLFGYEAHEIVGHSIGMLMPAERAHEQEEILATIARGESVKHLETVRLRKDGEKIDVSVTISPIRDATGVVVGASKIARDITQQNRDRRSAEERLVAQTQELSGSRDALEKQTRMLQLVLDSMGEGLVATDEAGHFLIWNDSAKKLVGQCPTDLSAEQWTAHYDCYQDDGTTPVPTERLPLVRAMRGESSQAQMMIRRPGGRPDVLLEFIGRPMKDDTGKLCGGVIAFRDVTKRKADEREIRQGEQDLARKVDELARSNADLQQFAYIASHDLQEPLRMVAAYTELLRERYQGRLDEDADKFIGYACEGALRMQTLIRDLLAFSRVGRNCDTCERVDCNVAAEEVLLSLQAAIRESGAQVTHGDLPALFANRSQVVQILQNLIGNAIKFRGTEAPVISVQAERKGLEWVFSVADNGIGIAPEQAENVFVVFQRLHSRAEYPGNGIGLAICKKIVEHCGGKIWVDAQSSHGSVFKFSWPMRVREEGRCARC